MSELEKTLAFQLRAEGITDYETEYRFCPERRWRADIAFLPTDTRRGVLVEVQGGIHRSGSEAGRHNRGAALEKQYERNNRAALDGWTLLEFGPSQIRSGEALDTIKRALGEQRAV